MEMKALSLKYSNPVLSQIQGCAIFLRYWVKLLGFFPDDIRLCQDLQKQKFANSDTFGGSSEHPGSVQSRYKVDSESWQCIQGLNRRIGIQDLDPILGS